MLTKEELERLRELSTDSTEFHFVCKWVAASFELPYPAQYDFYINTALETGKFSDDVRRVSQKVLAFDEEHRN